LRRRTALKPLVPRERANQDVDEALAYYLEEGGPRVALGFIDALERVYAQVRANPLAGSPRYAGELNLPGLRYWLFEGYPYLVFYVERDDHIDVWRVLHGQRDIPAWMQQPEG
jgi:toxin ParE1/3/4